MSTAPKKLLFVFGTRPEAIKMAPLIKEAQKTPDRCSVKICITSQHRQMLDQVLKFFNIDADYDLDVMSPNQTLFDITTKSLMGLKSVLESWTPDFILVQGDTTSAFTGALAGFYQNVQVVHIEAGLRSGDKRSPFPEEMNRILAGHMANLHFAPTQRAMDNLANEGIKNNVHLVGNTVIDALFLGLETIQRSGDGEFQDFFHFVDFSKKVILVTGHRRESFGQPFRDMCLAFKEIVEKNPDVELVFPVHLNPRIQEPVREILKDVARIHLIAPLDYPFLIWLMNKAHMVLTDSGGIQEEAPSLGKPVLVMRDVTERVEGIEAGTAILVGSNGPNIAREAQKLLSIPEHYKGMAQAVNPYGDGDACQQIMAHILED